MTKVYTEKENQETITSRINMLVEALQEALVTARELQEELTGVVSEPVAAREEPKVEVYKEGEEIANDLLIGLAEGLKESSKWPRPGFSVQEPNLIEKIKNAYHQQRAFSTIREYDTSKGRGGNQWVIAYKRFVDEQDIFLWIYEGNSKDGRLVALGYVESMLKISFKQKNSMDYSSDQDCLIHYHNKDPAYASAEDFRKLAVRGGFESWDSLWEVLNRFYKGRIFDIDLVWVTFRVLKLY